MLKDVMTRSKANHILGCENEQRIVDLDNEEKSEGLGVGLLCNDA
jgi:hypothetical protein